MGKNETFVKPFGMADKLGYMFGDFGNDFTFLLSSTFLMKFYTDVMGVSAYLVGLMMMLARFVDAFTDVAMGQICDRCPSTPKGKFLPWIRRIMGPVAAASFLCYAVWFKDMPMTFKVAWMFFSYLLWGSVCFTAINIPYGSMASAISADAKDRTVLSTFRAIGANLAGIFTGVVLPIFVYYKDANGNTVLSGGKMAVAALICSVLAIVCYLFCYCLTTERVKYEAKKKEERSSLKTIFVSIISSRSLIGIIVVALLFLVASFTISGMGNYIYPNYFGNSGALSLSTLLARITNLIFAAVLGGVAVKYGKKELSAAGCFLGAAALFAAYVVHTDRVAVWMVFYLISNVGNCFFNILCWAMIIDVIDDIEVKKGVRSDGTVYACYSFARKLGQAGSAGLTGVLLSVVGYTEATAFDYQVVNGIYDITCLVPAVTYVAIGAALIFLFPLNKKRVEENAEILQKRREEK